MAAPNLISLIQYWLQTPIGRYISVLYQLWIQGRQEEQYSTPTLCVSCRWIGILKFASLSSVCLSAPHLGTLTCLFLMVQWPRLLSAWQRAETHCVWRVTAVTYFWFMKAGRPVQLVSDICTFKLAYAHISKRMQLWKKNLTVLLCRDVFKPHPIDLY